MSSVIYAWVLDGVPTIFVSDEGLDDAWAVLQGFVDTKVGLRRPTSLAAKVNLRDLMPGQTPTTITVDDLDGTLPALFGKAASTGEALVTTLEAATDPAPLALKNKHVGTEYIGTLRERRVYSCIPGFAVGLRHLGQNEAYANGGSTTPVSDTPLAWTGRRCAVYRVELVDAGAATEHWQDLADAERVWWGTLRGQGKMDKSSAWAFGCLGPDSWMGGNLGTGNFQDGLRTLPLTILVDDGFAGPTVMRADLELIDLQKPEDGSVAIIGNYALLNDPSGTSNMGTVTGYDDVAAAVNTFFDGLIAELAHGPAFNANGNDLKFSTEASDGITFRWLRGDTANEGDPRVTSFTNPGSMTARLRLIMSEQVWKLLGYDVIQQVNGAGGRDAVEHEDQYGQFTPVGFPAGYYQGLFYAANPKATKASDDNDFGNLIRDDYSSGGFDRVWPTLYPGGAFTWSGQPGQEFQLDTPDAVLLAGSKARPLAEDTADGTAFELGGGVGDVNRSGVFLLEGPYRRRGDQDQNDPAQGYAFDLSRERREGKTLQPVRVCWRATPGGVITTDTDGKPRLVVQEWLEPRYAGFDYEPLDGTWGGFRKPPPGGEPIRARPLLVFDYGDGGDKMTTVLRRVLQGTGTAGEWYVDAGLTTPLFGLGAGSAFLDVGANDDGGTIPGDAEVASMGLGIPASMVADPAVWDAVGSVPGAHLSRCKVVAGVAAKARDIVSRMLAPTGLALGYSGGKYTPFDAWVVGNPTDAALVITTELYALGPGKKPSAGIPTQNLRKWAPLDLVTISGRIEPVGGGYFRELERSASDAGARYRAQQVVHRVNGDHLVHPLLPTTGASWQQDIPQRWRQAFAFWGANNSTVNLPLHAEDAKHVWPGDVVLVTDPWLLDTLGAYGVSSAVGNVIGRVYNAAAETVTLEIMLAAETDFRMWGPSAVVTEYDEAGPFRLLCEDDHLDDRGGLTLDVDGFAEPSYSTEGGDADVEIFEFDGNTVTRGIFGVVASVDSTPGSSSITLTGALTGAAWNSDRHHWVVLREWGAQGAAWVKRWHAPTCAKDGTHTGGQPGIKWRGL